MQNAKSEMQNGDSQLILMTPRREDLEHRLLHLAARGRVVDALPDTGFGRRIAGQLIHSGTPSAPKPMQHARHSAVCILTLSMALFRAVYTDNSDGELIWWAPLCNLS